MPSLFRIDTGVTQVSSFSRLFSGGALHRNGARIPELRAQRLFSAASADEDDVRGKVQRGKRAAAPPRPSKALDAKLGPARQTGYRASAAARGAPLDHRQRAIVKIHFFGHGGGGGASLKAHGRYIARDATRADQIDRPDRDTAGREDGVRAHAEYLKRDDRLTFYDALGDNVDGSARMAFWADADRRHFRIILSPEQGMELGDLKPYVRQVMERVEAALGRLEWVAINHYDTDNPHTHIVLRGRHQNGRPLILPRAFIKQGMREIARDVATDRLGPRTRADAQKALLREARAHRPTRLDTILASQIERDQIRISRVTAPNRDPDLTRALKARARELQRLGLATEPRRNVLSFQNDWRDRLRVMELHLDIRKRVILDRTRQQQPPMPGRGPIAGLLRGPER